MCHDCWDVRSVGRQNICRLSVKPSGNGLELDQRSLIEGHRNWRRFVRKRSLTLLGWWRPWWRSIYLEVKLEEMQDPDLGDGWCVSGLGPFLNIVCQDVKREERNTFVASGLPMLEVMAAVAKHARHWLLNEERVLKILKIKESKLSSFIVYRTRSNLYGQCNL